MDRDFFKKTYGVVRKIPAGKVATYGQVASLIQKSKIKINAKVVGWALHANKDLKIPCHRVVDRNGRLAPNFAFDGAKKQKRRLLMEGVTFKDEMHVDLAKHKWQPK